MFAKLLHAVRRWFSATFKREQPKAGPPSDWLKARDPGPPEHWLKIVRGSAPTTWINNDDGLKNARPQTWPVQQTRAPERTAHNLDPRPEPASPSASSGRRRIAEPLWNRTGKTSEKTDHQMPLIARFIRKLKALKPVSPESGPDRSRDRTPRTSDTAHRIQGPPVRGAEVVNWQSPMEPVAKKQRPVRPTSPTDSNRKRFPALSDSVRPIPFPTLPKRREDEFVDFRIPVSKADLTRATSSSRLNPAAIEVRGERHEVLDNLAPTYWPELSEFKESARKHSQTESPDSRRITSDSFSLSPDSQGVPLNTFSAKPPNSWPSLAPDPAARSSNERSMRRSLQRSQRLEKEQRGF